MKLQEGTVVRRLGKYQDLQEVARHIQAGRESEAATALRKIADALDQ
jgi:hypothetical protein